MVRDDAGAGRPLQYTDTRVAASTWQQGEGVLAHESDGRSYLSGSMRNPSAQEVEATR